MKRIIEFFVLLALISFGFTFCVKDDPPTVVLDISVNIVFPPLPLPPLPPDTDQDGNTYKTAKIGNQIWMAENLRTTKYNDGTPIPNVTAWSEWSDLLTGAYCWYDNEEDNYRSEYGAFYNGFAVRTGKLCPIGWHVPGLSDWTTLITYLGGWDVAGGKLKEAGTSHWEDPNAGATNESGFTALPGGTHLMSYQPGWNIFCRSYNPYSGIGKYSEWWSSTADTYLHGALVYLGLWSLDERVFGLDTPSQFMEYGNDIEWGRDIINGCYVRCVKDN